MYYLITFRMNLNYFFKHLHTKLEERELSYTVQLNTP